MQSGGSFESHVMLRAGCEEPRNASSIGECIVTDAAGSNLRAHVCRGYRRDEKRRIFGGRNRSEERRVGKECRSWRAAEEERRNRDGGTNVCEAGATQAR